MNKKEQAILDARTPEEYVDRSLRSKLSPAQKAQLSKQWLAKTGYTHQDILYARNRHPYWKERKLEGAAERTRKRMDMHDYSGGKEKPWTSARIAEFLELNKKDKAGHYLHKDWELADHLQTTIPSVQYMRRKYRKVIDLLGPRVGKPRLIQSMGLSELLLSRGELPAKKRG